MLWIICKEMSLSAFWLLSTHGWSLKCNQNSGALDLFRIVSSAAEKDARVQITLCELMRAQDNDITLNTNRDATKSSNTGRRSTSLRAWRHDSFELSATNTNMLAAKNTSKSVDCPHTLLPTHLLHCINIIKQSLQSTQPRSEYDDSRHGLNLHHNRNRLLACTLAQDRESALDSTGICPADRQTKIVPRLPTNPRMEP